MVKIKFELGSVSTQCRSFSIMVKWSQYHIPVNSIAAASWVSWGSQALSKGSRPQTPSVLLMSPDSDLVGADLPSPAEDFQTYAQLMVRMAKSLDLQIHRPTTEPTDHLYDPISKDTTSPVHISMLPSLLSTARHSWRKPVSSHSMSKCSDNL